MSSDVVQGVNRSWAETPPTNPPLRHAIGEVVERQTWLDKLANPVQNWLLAFFGPKNAGIIYGAMLTAWSAEVLDEREMLNARTYITP
jgi:hypothetical protein